MLAAQSPLLLPPPMAAPPSRQLPYSSDPMLGKLPVRFHLRKFCVSGHNVVPETGNRAGSFSRQMGVEGLEHRRADHKEAALGEQEIAQLRLDRLRAGRTQILSVQAGAAFL